MMAVIVVVLPWLALPVSSTSPLVAEASSRTTSGSFSSASVLGRWARMRITVPTSPSKIAHVHPVAAVVVDGHVVEVEVVAKLLLLVLVEQLQRQPLALLRGQRPVGGRHQLAGDAKHHRRAGRHVNVAHLVRPAVPQHFVNRKLIERRG